MGLLLREFQIETNVEKEIYSAYSFSLYRAGSESVVTVSKAPIVTAYRTMSLVISAAHPAFATGRPILLSVIISLMTR